MLSDFWSIDVATAHLLKHNISMEELSLLELGSGCGLGGIVAGKYFKKFKRLTLTDLNDSVLKRLHENVELNFDESTIENIRIERLDWLNYNIKSTDLQLNSPNIIFASGIIFY